MDAFKWDDERKLCTESHIGEMNPPLPMLHMIPRRNFHPNPSDYIAPLYRTAARAGTLSTTGNLSTLDKMELSFWIYNFINLKVILLILWLL